MSTDSVLIALVKLLSKNDYSNLIVTTNFILNLPKRVYVARVQFLMGKLYVQKQKIKRLSYPSNTKRSVFLIRKFICKNLQRDFVFETKQFFV